MTPDELTVEVFQAVLAAGIFLGVLAFLCLAVYGLWLLIKQILGEDIEPRQPGDHN